MPQVLYLPLNCRHLHFSRLIVAHAQEVSTGEVLAKDPDNFDVPLLAPCSGTVDLKESKGHITLTELSVEDRDCYACPENLEHIHSKVGPSGFKRYKLLNLGAWEYLKDAYTGHTPDPLSNPQAIIVSTFHPEPFLVRGDVLLKEYLRQFTRGLEHLQSLLEYQPIYLIVPRVKTDFAAEIKEHMRGYAWVKLIEVPLIYPHDNFEILSRRLGLKRTEGPVWGLHVEGVLAIDNALTSSRPCTERIISVAGPGATAPQQLRLMIGYPISEIVRQYASGDAMAIEGGLFSGRVLNSSIQGVSSECRGITFIPEHQHREFLGFVRPGFDRQSYSACFLSSLCSLFPERLTNGVRGELRPCVSCGFCQEVCPAGVIPYRLHKLIYQNNIDEVERSRVDLCIECGLCAFVCPSKIELTQQFHQIKEAIAEEKAAACAEAAKKSDDSLARTG